MQCNLVKHPIHIYPALFGILMHQGKQLNLGHQRRILIWNENLKKIKRAIDPCYQTPELS